MSRTTGSSCQDQAVLVQGGVGGRIGSCALSFRKLKGFARHSHRQILGICAAMQHVAGHFTSAPHICQAPERGSIVESLS